MKIKTKIGIISTLVLLLTSCNKWLDIDLANTIDERDLFKTSEGFNEALAGVYSTMAGANLYGEKLSMQYLDVYAQYYAPAETSSPYLSHQNYDYENSGVAAVHSTIWNNMYSAISGANNIIRWADINTSVLTSDEYKQIVGEAIAMRAFLHFDLIRMFCADMKVSPKENGIPYNKVFGVSLPPQYTVEECVQLVLNDLSEAEKLLADDPITDVVPYAIAASNKNAADKYVARMNIYAVKALKARLYLMRGEYTKAIEAAREVIESGKFRLLEFTSVDAAEAEMDMLFSDEHIFSLRNKDIPEYAKPLYQSSTTGNVTTLPALTFRSVANIYEANNDDQRYVKWFDSGSFRKYTVDNSGKFFKKIPVIKLSEMYLIVAEGYYSTNPSKALEYINALRDHRIRNNVHWEYISRDFIVEEMAREFLGEGQLWYAYKRLNRAIPTGSAEGDVAPDNKVFVFPIPDNEIENGHRNQNQ